MSMPPPIHLLIMQSIGPPVDIFLLHGGFPGGIKEMPALPNLMICEQNREQFVNFYLHF
uniref:Uncharacterized protein n=1 Tax=Anguilla anguilla TaxID=7936 RepID=A0A0E9TPN6_ANGAN